MSTTQTQPTAEPMNPLGKYARLPSAEMTPAVAMQLVEWAGEKVDRGDPFTQDELKAWHRASFRLVSMVKDVQRLISNDR